MHQIPDGSFCAEYVKLSSWTRLRRRIVYTEKKAKQGTAGHPSDRALAHQLIMNGNTEYLAVPAELIL